MAYPLPTGDNFNASQGLNDLFIYSNSVSNGWLFRLMLISFFIILSMSVYRGKKDFPMAFAVGGFATSIIAILLRIAGVIDLVTLTFTLVIGFTMVLWLFFSRD